MVRVKKITINLLFCYTGNEVFMDGGMVANNPTLIALEEADTLWGIDNVSLVLSIGTGTAVQESVALSSLFLKQSVIDNAIGLIGLADTLASVSCNSSTPDSIIETFLSKKHNFQYTRLNPPISKLELDTVNPAMLSLLVNQVESYLISDTATAELKKVASLLLNNI